MNWIQVLLIMAVTALLVFLLRSRGSVQARAWVKVGWVLFVIVAVYAVLRPNDTTVVALLCGPLVGSVVHLTALRMVPAP